MNKTLSLLAISCIVLSNSAYGYKYGLKNFYYANTPDGDGETEKGMNCDSGACAI